TDKTKSQKSKNLLVEFQRFVEYFNPGYVVVENVPGVLRKKSESGLEAFITMLKSKGYVVHFQVHNVNDYGVPQNRMRFTLIANRVSDHELEPVKYEGKRLTVADVLGEHNGFPKIVAGNKDLSDLAHTSAGITPINLDRLRLVKKDGGDRMAFAHIERLQLNCFKGKDHSFKDTYGRMWWNRPSPT